MIYEAFRQLVDSWGLAVMFGIFLFAVYRALRPSARAHFEEAQSILLRDEEPGQ